MVGDLILDLLSVCRGICLPKACGFDRFIVGPQRSLGGLRCVGGF